MNPVIVRGIKIGEGMPKICVSLTAKNKAELLEDAASIACDLTASSVIDIVEWRADYYEGPIEGQVRPIEPLAELRQIIGDKPLIFTYRTANEGGVGSIDFNYESLLKEAIDSGLVDFVDVELFMGDETVSQLIAYARANGVKVIASNHDFDGTPELEEIVTRLQNMQKLGADILKIAVMPKNMKDVLTLLEATVIMSEQYAQCPLVTIAMSDLGAITRVTGEVFGSSITFGTLGKSSAPGQIAAPVLSDMLVRVHHLFPNENKL
ncbi:MAG TPA: type I 3-dehydroquinate dehydratase [Fusibacter sp.]|nr:type I 3-dehydroquinate dehydratase [Fusibacter sp.]